MWNFPLFPDSASTVAPRVDAVFIGLILVSAMFTLAFAFFVLYFAVKYRRGSKADRSNVVNSNPIAEAVYITLPTLLGIGLFVWGTITYFEIVTPPGDAIDIYVIGKQWMWKAHHPQGRKEINMLHVPVNQPVRLKMRSQDVIHSFFIPDFRVKQDVVPGIETSLWFEATKTGDYKLFCTEYCGTNHSRMIGMVRVLDQADYEAWLEAGSNSAALAAEGQQLFRRYHCSGCHGGNGSVKAPPLEGVFDGPVPLLVDPKDPSQGVEIIKADRRYIVDSIRRPQDEVVAGYEPLMPPFPPEALPEDDLLKILAYIKSIGRGSDRTPDDQGPGAPTNVTEVMSPSLTTGGDEQ